MTHDPLCPRDSHPKICEGDGSGCPACQCELIANVRADERRWVTGSAGRELLNHKVKDGVCACGMDAPDALEHLAWIVSDYVRHSLKPEHEVKPVTVRVSNTSHRRAMSSGYEKCRTLVPPLAVE